jgi:hypothetical protein
VEITIVMVVNTMEDDKTFSIINFMKSTQQSKNGERRNCNMEKSRWLVQYGISAGLLLCSTTSIL